jgi:hypothetical protein
LIAFGRRILDTFSTAALWYGAGSEILDETDATGSTTNAAFSEYIYFHGQRVARRDYQGNAFYYFADQVGSSRGMAASEHLRPLHPLPLPLNRHQRLPVPSQVLVTIRIELLRMRDFHMWGQRYEEVDDYFHRAWDASRHRGGWVYASRKHFAKSVPYCKRLMFYGRKYPSGEED